jgi:enoyl-CoA hydratase/carnithine racemase
MADLPSPDLLQDLRPDGVLVLTLHRPERGNAWTIPLEAAYFAALAAAADDPAVRAVVLTGAGDSFCPGMDAERLTEISAGASVDIESRPSVTAVRRFPKPLIAAINGACAGIGLVHALLCDVRFVADSARVSTAFTRRGLAGERTITWLLPRIVGMERALDLLLTARTISGTEAHQLGLASRLAPRETVLADAIAYAGQLGRCSPLAVALVREQVYADADRSFDESSAAADALTVRTAAGPDFAESVRAWAERRPAEFAPLPVGFDARAWTGESPSAAGL